MTLKDIPALIVGNAVIGILVGLLAYLAYRYTGHLMTQWLSPETLSGPLGFFSRKVGFPAGAIVGAFIGRIVWVFTGP